VHHEVVLGAGSPCPEPGGGRTAAEGTLTDVVVHCLSVSNEGGRPLDHVVVRSPTIGLGSEGAAASPAWTIDELAPGEHAGRRIEVPVDGLVSATTTATADDDGRRQQAEADVVVQVRPAALTVSRVFASPSDPACGTPLASPAVGDPVSWCIAVTNTGGTFLRDITVSDAAVSADPIAIPGTLEPGGSASARGGGTVLADPDVAPAARATSADRAGAALGEPGAVTSETAPGPGLRAEGQVSATRVRAGESVTMSVAVTNTADEPVDDVRVDTSTCGSVARPSARLADNGDATLQAGETWLYVCSAPVYTEMLAVASVVTPAQSVQTTPTFVSPEFADLRVKISQKNDLRVGSQTTYELKVQNTGDLPADNVVLTSTLPAGVTAVSGVWQTVVPPEHDLKNPPPDQVGPANPCQVSADRVVCSIGTIPAQVALEYVLGTVIVTADPAVVDKVVSFSAEVRTSTPEERTTDNSDSKLGKVFAAADCADSRDCDPTGGGGGGGGGGEPPVDPPGARPYDPTVGSRQGLAQTGIDIEAALAWGVVLLAAGLTLVAAGRRRYLLASLPVVS
jgi:uncharacterized repeat protein (TIGR01451 family)